jgi:hypothetical protein
MHGVGRQAQIDWFSRIIHSKIDTLQRDYPKAIFVRHLSTLQPLVLWKEPTRPEVQQPVCKET